MIRPRARIAVPYTSQALGGTGSRSRRSTRNGGTRPSPANGGRAKPASATRPVATPAAAGQMPPGNLLRQQIAQEIEQPVLCGPAEQGADRLASRPSMPSCRHRAAARHGGKGPGIGAAHWHRSGVWRSGQPTVRRQRLPTEWRPGSRGSDSVPHGPVRPYLPVAIAGGFDALMGLQTGLQRLLVSRQCSAFAAPELPVANSAAGLDDTGRRKIVQVHQHAWRQAVEITDPIGLVGQHASQAQQLVADFDVVTDCQVQGGEQPGLGPGFTRAGPAPASSVP